MTTDTDYRCFMCNRLKDSYATYNDPAQAQLNGSARQNSKEHARLQAGSTQTVTEETETVSKDRETENVTEKKQTVGREEIRPTEVKLVDDMKFVEDTNKATSGMNTETVKDTTGYASFGRGGGGGIAGTYGFAGDIWTCSCGACSLFANSPDRCPICSHSLCGDCSMGRPHL